MLLIAFSHELASVLLLTTGAGGGALRNAGLDVDGLVLTQSTVDVLRGLVTELRAEGIETLELEERIEEEYAEGGKRGVQPLDSSETVLMDLEDATGVLAHEELTTANREPDKDEQRVGQDAVEHVEAVIDLS